MEQIFVSAGKLLQAHYPHIYWTPCVAHCLDMILEDIGKLPDIDRTIKKAIQLTSFIYQRSSLLNLMRKFTDQKNLLRPWKTRFATSFITLSSINEQKKNPGKMFLSQEWMDSKYAKEVTGKKKNLLRLGKTRFATSFITLSSINEQKKNMRKMFLSQE
ncbi:hypothetical protein V2J09_012803 [Rumex salicifolius]